MEKDVHGGTVDADILTRPVISNLVIEHGQLRDFDEVAETLLQYDGIGHTELIVSGLLGIDGCPCVETADILCLQSLWTEVLE